MIAPVDPDPMATSANEAVAALRAMDEPIEDVLRRRGRPGLVELPGIGAVIARAVEDIVEIGTSPRLEHLKGQFDPEATFQTVPGIGAELAGRIHHDLGIADLEELEAVACSTSISSTGSDPPATSCQSWPPYRFNPDHEPWLPVLRRVVRGREAESRRPVDAGGW